MVLYIVPFLFAIGVVYNHEHSKESYMVNCETDFTERGVHESEATHFARMYRLMSRIPMFDQSEWCVHTNNFNEARKSFKGAKRLIFRTVVKDQKCFQAFMGHLATSGWVCTSNNFQGVDVRASCSPTDDMFNEGSRFKGWSNVGSVERDEFEKDELNTYSQDFKQAMRSSIGIRKNFTFITKSKEPKLLTRFIETKKEDGWDCTIHEGPPSTYRTMFSICCSPSLSNLYPALGTLS